MSIPPCVNYEKHEESILNLDDPQLLLITESMSSNAPGKVLSKIGFGSADQNRF